MHNCIHRSQQIFVGEQPCSEGPAIERAIRQVSPGSKQGLEPVARLPRRLHDPAGHLVGERHGRAADLQHRGYQRLPTRDPSRQADAQPAGLLYIAHVAKLRTNHGSGRSGGRFGASLRPAFILGALLLLVLYLVFDRPALPEAVAPAPVEVRLYLPVGPSSQVIDHRLFSLGYDNDWEQARWVAHHLSAAEVRAKGLPRSNDFRLDPAVRDRSADGRDYRSSGYTRGHLVPSGDLNYDALGMSESFLYSNISPQLAEYNGGVWRELEESVREWTVGHGELYIVTGPIVGLNPVRIGANRVAVPSAFYKALLTPKGDAIAFVIPHELQTASLTAFAKTIDEVEEITGLDLFPELSTLATPENEAAFDLKHWPLSERRYRQRLGQWNHPAN